MSRMIACLTILTATSVLLFVAEAQPPAPLEVLHTLKEHTETVYHIAFTPDEQRLVTSSFDKTLKLWDVASGREIRTYGGPNGHTNLVMSFAISPDGKVLTTVGADNNVKQWDIPSEGPIRELLGHTDAVQALALFAAPDGVRLATAGKDKTIRIWNFNDGKQLLALEGHTATVRDVAFTPDGKLLASVGEDQTLRVWNTADGKPITSLLAHSDVATGVVFTSAVTVYTAGNDGNLRYWILPAVPPRTLNTPHGDTVSAMLLSVDNARLYTASKDKTVRVALLQTGAQERVLPGPTVALTSLSQAPPLLAAGAADGSVYLWNTQQGTLTHQLPAAHPQTVSAVALTAAGNQLLTAGTDGSIKLWALPPKPERKIDTPSALSALAFSADGTRVFAAGADKTLRSWTLQNNALGSQLTGHTDVIRAIAASPRSPLVATGSADRTIRFWDTAQKFEIGAHAAPVTNLVHFGEGLLSAGEDGIVKFWTVPSAVPKVMPHPDSVTCGVMSSDGQRLITGCNDKIVRVWNVVGAQAERTLPAGSAAIKAVAIHPNGVLAIAQTDNVIRIATATSESKIEKIPAAVNEVAFSPDQTSLAAACADGLIRIYTVKDGMETKAIKGHTGAVIGLTYVGSGQQILSAGADGTAQIWNLADDKSLLKVVHGSAIKALTLSKDGTRFATAGADKIVKTWTLKDGMNVGTLTRATDVTSIALSADGQRILVAGADKEVQLYSVAGVLLQFFTHEAIGNLAFFTVGNNVVTAGADNSARLWTPNIVWHAGTPAAEKGRAAPLTLSPQQNALLFGDDKIIRILNPTDGKELRTIPNLPAEGLDLATDGKIVAALLKDNRVHVYSLAEGKPVSTIALTSPGRCLALAADGSKLAVGSGEKGDNLIHIFDPATGRKIQTVAGNAGPIERLQYVGDNRTLFSVGADKTLRTFDTAVIRELPGHMGGVTALALHPNQTQVFSAGADKTVRQWDLATGNELRAFGSVQGAIANIALSREGVPTRVAAAGAEKTVRIWNIADGKEVLALPHPAGTTSLQFSPDSTRLATAGEDNKVRVWELALGRELQLFTTPNTPRTISFGVAPNVLMVGGDDKTVTIHTLAVSRVVAAHSGAIHSLSVPANPTQLITAGQDGHIRFVNINTGNFDRTISDHMGGATCARVTPNNILWVTTGADRKIRFYTTADGKEIKAIDVPTPIQTLAISPDSKLLVAGGTDGRMSVWDIAMTPGQPLPTTFGTQMAERKSVGAIQRLAFLADNATFLSTHAEKEVRAWKIPSDSPLRTLPGHAQVVDTVAYSPDGLTVATAGHDGTVRLWEAATGKPIKAIPLYTTPAATAIYSLVWLPDSKQFLVSNLNRTLKLVDVASGSTVREFKGYDPKDVPLGHREGIFSIALTADGKLAATSGSDGLVNIWNVADGTIARQLLDPALPAAGIAPAKAHQDWINHVHLTPDGKKFVTVGNGGWLKIWNFADGKLLYQKRLMVGLQASAVSRDGKLLLLAAIDGTAQICKMPVP